jgi:hypothetical protein
MGTKRCSVELPVQGVELPVQGIECVTLFFRMLLEWINPRNMEKKDVE